MGKNRIKDRFLLLIVTISLIKKVNMEELKNVIARRLRVDSSRIGFYLKIKKIIIIEKHKFILVQLLMIQLEKLI